MTVQIYLTVVVLVVVLAIVPSIQCMKTVAVAGASGRLGVCVINELLASTDNIRVKALVRDATVQNKLNMISDRLDIVTCDLSSTNQVRKALKDVDCTVWCAAGFSEKSSKLNQLIAGLKLKFFPQISIDISTVSLIGKLMKDKEGLVDNGPKVVLVSSAGITRPIWSDEKKKLLIGASDIPIVRLNPLNILGVKRDGEQALRDTGVDYTIIRPCGLNDNWPSGRPVFSQGKTHT